MHALRPLHILWRYVAYGCLPWFLYGLLFRLLPAKRETVGSTAFGVVMENTPLECNDTRSCFHGYICRQTDAGVYRFHPHSM